MGARALCGSCNAKVKRGGITKGQCVFVLGKKENKKINKRKFNTIDVETNIDTMCWVRNFLNINWLPSWILGSCSHP